MPEAPTIDYQSAAPVVVKPALRPVFQRVAGWSLFIAIVISAFIAGLILRRWAWDQTEPIRYTSDINNAFRQGTMALQAGYIDRYDEQETRPVPEGNGMDLDYAPGRLAIATLWTRWVREKVDGQITDPKKIRMWPQPFYTRARMLHRQYELVEPMLMVNLTGEILSAIAMFLLVQRYTSGRSPFQRAGPAVSLQTVSMLLVLGTLWGFSTGLFSRLGWGYSLAGISAVSLAVAGLSELLPRGTLLGLAAALFFWFDPGLICNAHCWPQWDSWVMPFFLWAVVMASWDCWFCAGAIIACGAMFKGQILFGAPVFLLWPLFQWRLPALMRWIIGLLTAVAAITLVWMVRIPGTRSEFGEFLPGKINADAVTWLIYLALIFVAMPAILWWPRNRYARIPIAAVISAVIMWTIAAHTNQTFSIIGFLVLGATAWFADNQCERWSWHAKLPLGWFAIGLLIYPIYRLASSAAAPAIAAKADHVDPIACVGLVVIATIAVGMLLAFAPRRTMPYAAAAWMSAAIFACIPVFHATHGWFDLGIAYGTHHFERMASGQIDNLPELLQYRWSWDNLMEPVVTIPKGATADHIASFLTEIDPGVRLQPGSEIGLPLKYFLVCMWLISVVLCAAAVARHDRNRSPRFLAAIVAPWIVFFAVMTQMHQRYLLWGGSLSAATSVLSPGYFVLHLFLSIVSMSQELQSMMNNMFDYSGRHYTDNIVYEMINNWHPGIAWAVLLTAGIFLYTAVKWDKSLE